MPNTELTLYLIGGGAKVTLPPIDFNGRKGLFQLSKNSIKTTVSGTKADDKRMKMI